MSEFLVQRNINDFLNSYKNIFDMMSINTKYNIIGSSNLKNIRYNSDYDLQNTFNSKKNINNQVVKKIQSNIKNLNNKKNDSFVVDFKCGVDSKGESLHWTVQEIKNNKKEVDNNIITLQDAIKQKSTIKLDVIVFIGSSFVDITENYYIKIGDVSNFDKLDSSIILKNIQQDIQEQIKENNYNKALKRFFSFTKINSPNSPILKDLVDFFNSDTGIINKGRADLDVILILLEKEIPVDITKIKIGLDSIKFQLSYNTLSDFTPSFLKLEKINNKKKLIKPILLLRNQLFNIVNNLSKEFYNNNIKNKI